MLMTLKLSMQHEATRGKNMVAIGYLSSIKTVFQSDAIPRCKTWFTTVHFLWTVSWPWVIWSCEMVWQGARGRRQMENQCWKSVQAYAQEAESQQISVSHGPTNLLFPVHPLSSDRAALSFTSCFLLPFYPARIHSAVVEIGQPHKWNKVVESMWEKAGVPRISISPHSPVFWETLRTEAHLPGNSIAEQHHLVDVQREDWWETNEFPGVVAFPLQERVQPAHNRGKKHVFCPPRKGKGWEFWGGDGGFSSPSVVLMKHLSRTISRGSLRLQKCFSPVDLE